MISCIEIDLFLYRKKPQYPHIGRQEAVQKFILQKLYNLTDSQADSPTMGIVSDAPSRTRFAGGVAGYSERNLIARTSCCW